MTKPLEDTVVANGIAHRVLRWGDEPVDVVLTHGFLDVGWSFDAVARKLVDAGHGVASFDWRGHGQSKWIGTGGYYHFADYVLDLDELVPKLADRPIHLVGHSMGGSACAMYAAARPKAVKTLTLIEGIGPPELEPRDPVQRLRAWLDGVAKVRSFVPKPIASTDEALARMRVQNPELSDELGLALIDRSTEPVEGGLRWSFDPLHKTWSPRPFQAEPFKRVLEAIAAPTLIVVGDRGFRLPDEAERVARIPDHRMVELEDVGHMIHWFRPNALAEALVSFYAEHPA